MAAVTSIDCHPEDLVRGQQFVTDSSDRRARAKRMFRVNSQRFIAVPRVGAALQTAMGLLTFLRRSSTTREESECHRAKAQGGATNTSRNLRGHRIAVTLPHAVERA